MSDHSHTAIDVHTHVVPENFPAYVGKNLSAPWPSMAEGPACHRHVMISGQNYRTVSHHCWDCAVRRADMDAQRITRQVLSPMPELLSYWLEAEDGAAISRYLNEVIAQMVSRTPQQFIGLGTIPLQDISLAISELDRAMHELGLAGVEIGTNVNGRVIGDPQFLPFFEAAAEWGAAIFVHPLRPTGIDKLVGTSPALEQVIAFPGETGLAAASMITGGTFARLPNLKLAFSHGGGTLSSLLPRLQHAWDEMPMVGKTLPMNPREAARRMYFDNLVYDRATLAHLIGLFGDSQIMLGTDYPFAIMEKRPLERLRELNLSPEVEAKLRFANAQRWLGLK